MGEGERRNKACHCGSGKKYKTCCLKNDEKTRYRGVNFKVKRDVYVDSISFNNITGEIRLAGPEGNVEVEDVSAVEWKQGENRTRVKSSFSTKETKMFLSPEFALNGNDILFGCDTNTAEIDGKKYHVCCITYANLENPKDGFIGEIQQLMCVDFSDDTYNAEKIGWLIAIDVIQRSLEIGSARIVLCVDHDLEAHREINNQKLAIVDGIYLPKNFQLMYATDKGTPVQNKLVKSAHKGASKVVSIIRDNIVPQQYVFPKLSEGKKYKIRNWRNDNLV